MQYSDLVFATALCIVIQKSEKTVCNALRHIQYHRTISYKKEKNILIKKTNFWETILSTILAVHTDFYTESPRQDNCKHVYIQKADS